MQQTRPRAGNSAIASRVIGTVPIVTIARTRWRSSAAIACARAVIPRMVEKKNGALFFTTGYSAIKPIAFITSLCIANSGLRGYAYCLQEELAPKGVYVGTVSINAFIADGAAAEPLKIADVYWDMYRKRDRIEEVFGPV